MIRRGIPHPVFDVKEKLRQTYLNLSFDELVNPLIIPKEEIEKQWDTEAYAVLDRIYYLAGLPRPNVGLSTKHVKNIEKILGKKLEEERIEALRQTLHGYKKGNISGDDLLEIIEETLLVSEGEAEAILDLFQEFKDLQPIPMQITLRSHMTSGWFITLSEMQFKKPLPIKLFSIDRCFRREQQEDTGHLKTYHSASCVVADNELDPDIGKVVSRNLLEPFGFKEFEIRKKPRSSSYYKIDSEHEVFAKHPSTAKMVEVADYGIYNPKVLSRYGIEFAVFNLGLGVERLAQILYEETDLRILIYPQFFVETIFSDEEIAKMIKVAKRPKTPVGRKVQANFEKVALRNKDVSAPCRFTIIDEKIEEKRLKVEIFAIHGDPKLLGKAALNEIFVLNGDILGVPMEGVEWADKINKNGIRAKYTYLYGFSNLVGAELEKLIRDGKNGMKEINVAMVKSFGDVNLTIDPAGLRYITANHKKIDIRGPAFIRARIEVG